MTELSDDPSSSFHDDDDTLYLHGNPLTMVRILAIVLHQWLVSRPLTWPSSRKYSSCQTRKWGYHVCCCGCGYKNSWTHVANADGEYYEVKESAVIPINHHDVDKSPNNILLTKEVLNAVDYKLIKDHKFTKSYGPKRLITDFRCQSVTEAKIPSQKQLQNHLYYFHQTKFKQKSLT